MASGEILYFTGSNCRICRLMTPLVDEIADEFQGRVAFTHLDSAKHAGRAAEYNVMAVPTIVALVDGEEVGRTVGAQTPGALKRIFVSAETGEPGRAVMDPRDRMLRVGFAFALGVLAVTTGQSVVWLAVAVAAVAAFWDLNPLRR